MKGKGYNIYIKWVINAKHKINIIVEKIFILWRRSNEFFKSSIYIYIFHTIINDSWEKVERIAKGVNPKCIGTKPYKLLFYILFIIKLCMCISIWSNVWLIYNTYFPYSLLFIIYILCEIILRVSPRIAIRNNKWS